MLGFSIKTQTNAAISKKSQQILKNANAMHLIYFGFILFIAIFLYHYEHSGNWMLLGFFLGGFAESAKTRYLAEYIRRKADEDN